MSCNNPKKILEDKFEASIERVLATSMCRRKESLIGKQCLYQWVERNLRTPMQSRFWLAPSIPPSGTTMALEVTLSPSDWTSSQDMWFSLMSLCLPHPEGQGLPGPPIMVRILTIIDDKPNSIIIPLLFNFLGHAQVLHKTPNQSINTDYFATY